MWFVDKADYARIAAGDIVETDGLEDLFAGKPVSQIMIRVTKRDGETFEIPTTHTMSQDQLKWLRAGSALNYIRSKIAN